MKLDHHWAIVTMTMTVWKIKKIMDRYYQVPWQCIYDSASVVSSQLTVIIINSNNNSSDDTRSNTQNKDTDGDGIKSRKSRKSTISPNSRYCEWIWLLIMSNDVIWYDMILPSNSPPISWSPPSSSHTHTHTHTHTLQNNMRSLNMNMNMNDNNSNNNNNNNNNNNRNDVFRASGELSLHKSMR